MRKLVYMFVCALSLYAAPALAARTVDTYLGPSDFAHFREVFAKGLASNDLQEIYYSSLHTNEIKRGNKDFCQKIAKLHESAGRNYENDFYLIALHKKVGCTNKIAIDIKTPESDFNTSHDIFYHVAAYTALGKSLSDAEKTKIAKHLQTLLKKSDTPASLAYAFKLANELGAAGAFLAERLEDAIAQADEVNGKMLRYSNGLSVTALVFTGVFEVSNAYKKPLPLNAAKAVKFANYFLNRRTVQKSRGAHLLLEALKPLANAKEIAPVCIHTIGNGQIAPGAMSLNIGILDILGNPLVLSPKELSITIQNKDQKTITEKLTPKSSDKTVYAVDLEAHKLTSGIYQAEINANGIYSHKLHFKVLRSVNVPSLEVGVAEADAGISAAASLNKVAYLKKFEQELIASNHQKILLKANLVDEVTKEPITVHQAFVRFYSQTENKEVIYVAQKDSSKAYKFDLDVSAEAGTFEYKSGNYQLYLIVGDSAISNSFEWLVADVKLSFPTQSKPEETTQKVVRQPLPAITHQFREPEKRPPRILSDIFSGLCIAPLFLLFLCWYKLGVNVSNFKLTLPAIGFHLGLAAIFGLFVLFWLQLNMFQTIRALVPIGLFTFVFGHRLLRNILQQRVSKTN